MTKLEFSQVIAYLSAATGKGLPVEAVEVYYDLLSDLPLEVLQLAVKRVALEHVWATFPSVAEIRQAAVLTMTAGVNDVSPAEAWAMAWRAAGRIDPELEELAYRELVKLPPRVAEAMRAFGVVAMSCGKEPISVVRAQFMKIYEQLLLRDQRHALLPPMVRQAISKLPKPVVKMIEHVGKMEE